MVGSHTYLNNIVKNIDIFSSKNEVPGSSVVLVVNVDVGKVGNVTLDFGEGDGEGVSFDVNELRNVSFDVGELRDGSLDLGEVGNVGFDVDELENVIVVVLGVDRWSFFFSKITVGSKIPTMISAPSTTNNIIPSIFPF